MKLVRFLCLTFFSFGFLFAMQRDNEDVKVPFTNLPDNELSKILIKSIEDAESISDLFERVGKLKGVNKRTKSFVELDVLFEKAVMEMVVDYTLERIDKRLKPQEGEDFESINDIIIPLKQEITLFDEHMLDFGMLLGDNRLRLRENYNLLVKACFSPGNIDENIDVGEVLTRYDYFMPVLAIQIATQIMDNVVENRNIPPHFVENVCTFLTMMVGKGLDINLNLFHKNTLLSLFALLSLDKFVACVLKNGADINHKNAFGLTPLIIAVENNEPSTVQLLLLYDDIDVNAQDIEGETALSTAVHYASDDEDEIVKLLLQHKNIDVDVKNADGITPLMEAIQGGLNKIALEMVKKSKDVNITDDVGASALIYAAFFDLGEVVRSLIANGANINIKNNKGNTPLIIAARKGNREIAVNLVGSGADMDIRNEEDETALLAALAPVDGDQEMQEAKHDVALYLIQLGADVNIANEHGYTPLMLAVLSEDVEIVRQLLKAGADVSAEDEFGGTPLMLAAVIGNFEIAWLLLESVKDKSDEVFYAILDEQNDEGRTALMLAAYHGHFEIVKFLLELGADVTIKDKYDNTAMDFAHRRFKETQDQLYGKIYAAIETAPTREEREDEVGWYEDSSSLEESFEE